MRKIEIGPWLCDTPANDNLSDVLTKFENVSNQNLREILKLFFTYMFFSRLNKYNLYIVSLDREPDSYELCVAHPDLLLFPTLRKGIVVPVEEKDMFEVEGLNLQMCKLISSLNLLKVYQVQKNSELEKLSQRVLEITSGNQLMDFFHRKTNMDTRILGLIPLTTISKNSEWLISLLLEEVEISEDIHKLMENIFNSVLGLFLKSELKKSSIEIYSNVSVKPQNRLNSEKYELDCILISREKKKIAIIETTSHQHEHTSDGEKTWYDHFKKKLTYAYHLFREAKSNGWEFFYLYAYLHGFLSNGKKSYLDFPEIDNEKLFFETFELWDLKDKRFIPNLYKFTPQEIRKKIDKKFEQRIELLLSKFKRFFLF